MHIYAQEEGTKDGDIGVENASPEVILRALKTAKVNYRSKRKEFLIYKI